MNILLYVKDALKKREIFITVIIISVLSISLIAWWVTSKWWVLHELEKRFPPVSIEAKTNEAIAVSLLSLNSIESSSALISTPLTKLVPTAKPGFTDSFEINDGFSVKLDKFEISGAGQLINISSSFILNRKADGLLISGKVSASAIPFVAPTPLKEESLELSIAPVIHSWKFEKVQLGGMGFDLASIANLLSSALTSSTKQISERLGVVKTPIAISSDPKTILVPKLNGTKEPIEVPGFKATHIVVLVDANSVYTLFRLGAEEEIKKTLAPSTGDFNNFRSRFAEVIKRDFKHELLVPADPTIELSRSFVAGLSNFVPGKISASERIQNSVNSNYFRLGQAITPAAGVYISTKMIKEILLEQISAAANELSVRGAGGIIEPKVEMIDQALKITGRLERISIAPDVTVSGLVEGIVTPISSANAISLAGAFQFLDLDNFSISGWQLDPVKVILLMQHTRETLLPAINALIEPFVVQLKPVKPGAARLLPQANKTSNINFAPAEVALPWMTLGDPVVLMDSVGLRAFVSVTGIGGSVEKEKAPVVASQGIANKIQNAVAMNVGTLLDANLLNLFQVFSAQARESQAAKNPASIQNAPEPANTPIGFSDFKKRFEERWNSQLGSASPSDAEAFGFLPKTILASYINAAWPKGGINAEVSFHDVSPLKDTRHRIGHIDTNLNCNRTRECKRTAGVCDRSSSCAPKSCERGGCGRAPGECSYGCEICWSVGPYKDCKPDPVCEAGKLVCNTAVETRVAACNTREEAALGACNIREAASSAECNIREEAKVLECNIREEAAIFDCNRLAEMEVAACNIKKEALIGLSNLGDIGSTKGQVSYYGRGTIGLREMKVSDNLDSVEIGAQVYANGLIAAEVEFVPYGGIGHILGCQAPITFKPITRASVNNGVRIHATASFVEREKDAEKRLVYAISVPEIYGTGEMVPAPADALFLSNPEMTVVCPFLSTGIGLAALLGKGLTIITGKEIAKTMEDDSDATKAVNDTRNFFVQFGSGTAAIKVDPQLIDIDVPLIDLIISNDQRALLAKDHKSSILYELIAKPKPSEK